MRHGLSIALARMLFRPFQEQDSLVRVSPAFCGTTTFRMFTVGGTVGNYNGYFCFFSLTRRFGRKEKNYYIVIFTIFIELNTTNDVIVVTVASLNTS